MLQPEIKLITRKPNGNMNIVRRIHLLGGYCVVQPIGYSELDI